MIANGSGDRLTPSRALKSSLARCLRRITLVMSISTAAAHQRRDDRAAAVTAGLRRRRLGALPLRRLPPRRLPPRRLPPRRLPPGLLLGRGLGLPGLGRRLLPGRAVAGGDHGQLRADL